MLTSESTGLEFRRFLLKHESELVDRVAGLLNKKYRRTLLPSLKKGGDMPIIFGMLKTEDDITLYGQVKDVVFKKESTDFRMDVFLIMKDLKEQTRIMVTVSRDGDDYGTVFSTHAISRYKERLGLDSDMDFVDVCKHMIAVGRCANPGVFRDMLQVYGTNTNNRIARFTCLNGVYMGYYSIEKDMYYAETFLSPNDLREDQSFLNPETDPEHQRYKEIIEMLDKGTLPSYMYEELARHKGYEVKDGKLRFLSSEEELKEEQRCQKLVDENPDHFQDQAQANRTIAQRRIKRKGYK